MRGWLSADEEADDEQEPGDHEGGEWKQDEIPADGYQKGHPFRHLPEDQRDQGHHEHRRYQKK